MKEFFKRFFDVDTFIKPLVIAVLAGVILLYITLFPSSPDTPAPDNALTGNTVSGKENTDFIPDTPAPDNFSFRDIVAGGGNIDNPVFSSEVINDVNTNDVMLDSDVSDDSIPSETSYDEEALKASILEELISNLEADPANGTMPKGTAPITITLPNDLQEKLDSIQKLSIGSSKKWIDDKLGTPYAETVMDIKEDRIMRLDDDESSKTGEILVCVYNISDIIMVQAYYDVSDNACVAFFVTLLDDISGVDIMMPKFYSSLVSDKPLGEFAFSELGEYIMSTYGYIGQGIGRTFYGEEYYFGGAGNYETFYFAVLDYGMLDSRADFGRFLTIIQFNIGPYDNTLPLPEALNSKRERFYPNTYGISTLNSDLTFDLLGDYYWFDNLPLSNWSY